MYEIGGKNLKEDLTCFLCGKVMDPQEVEMRHEPAFMLERGCLAHYSPMTRETSVRFRCECGVECSLDIPDLAVYRLEKLCKINDIYEFDWEYIIMAVTSVKYGRVKNLGNYETERFEAEVVLSEGQTAEDAVIEAKAFVKKQLGLGPSSEDIEAARQLLAEAGEL